MPFLRLSRKIICGVKTINVTKSSSFLNISRNLMSKSLYYCEFGDPIQVVKFREVEVPPLKSQEVLVRMLAAPVNPADINTIQGKYPVKINLPIIPGNEGVGVVENIGNEISDICPGDRVIITKPTKGTWRNIGVFPKDVLRVIPKELGIVEAATLTVNPCTAYRMLSDFKPVRDGLVVIQNGANSACGQNIIQICKAWGVKNINIVRNRPEINELKKYLESLGATYVLTEEELRNTNIFKENKVNRPALALNCVGGKSALELTRHLDKSGIMVTYGAMSREPFSIPNAALIFKNISFHGFWMTAWNEKASADQKEIMMKDVISLMCEKKLKGPIYKMVKFEEYKEALANALTTQGFAGCRNHCLPHLPCVPGDEGVGEVVEIGNKVCTVDPGERVVLTSRGLGTWQYYGIYHERDIHVISPNIPLPEASMLTIAPCMAYRMLKDFKKIKPGQTVIQNAANSACGQSVIQLCKAWDINTFNIVANHCNYQSVKEHLLSIGATAVHTLEEAEELTTFNTSLSRPVLALNCLGGRFEDVMLRLLENSGTIIYYGSAFAIPIAKHIVRSDVFFNRFHLSEWDAYAGVIEKDVMMNNIIKLIVIGKFKAPSYQPLELKNYVHAFKNTVNCEAFSTNSYVFDFTLT
ncbi:enoyl-[acyl-carrier-protein] reductase, mitochondrial [Vanessa atalanta]|uniref:enoyl-[acyl-carrier-protein] reductase, mitochondrial n=1 Tax=Vanessa atalanta TaxID=42275 RepID=UPI001FCD8536|nr:enoyl-[acyl-carrier-protein] reductase, mitochondrial [Vanessa atalanta]